MAYDRKLADKRYQEKNKEKKKKIVCLEKKSHFSGKNRTFGEKITCFQNEIALFWKKSRFSK